MDERELLEGQENIEPNEEQVNQELENNGGEETTQDTVPLKTLLEIKRQLKETKYRLAEKLPECPLHGVKYMKHNLMKKFYECKAGKEIECGYKVIE